MAWTTPRNWVANEVVTAAIMNTHVRDNLSHLDSTRLETHSYAVTRNDAENTVAETTIFSATVADALADDDLLVGDLVYVLLNNSGSAVTFGIDVLYGGVESDLTDMTINASAVAATRLMHFVLGRKTATAAWCAISQHLYSGASWGSGTTSGAFLASPSFAAGQTFALKWTWGTAAATIYCRTHVARLRLVKA